MPVLKLSRHTVYVCHPSHKTRGSLRRAHIDPGDVVNMFQLKAGVLQEYRVQAYQTGLDCNALFSLDVHSLPPNGEACLNVS
jgi:hypothetical protein